MFFFIEFAGILMFILRTILVVSITWCSLWGATEAATEHAHCAWCEVGRVMTECLRSGAPFVHPQYGELFRRAHRDQELTHYTIEGDFAQQWCTLQLPIPRYAGMEETALGTYERSLEFAMRDETTPPHLHIVMASVFRAQKRWGDCIEQIELTNTKMPIPRDYIALFSTKKVMFDNWVDEAFCYKDHTGLHSAPGNPDLHELRSRIRSSFCDLVNVYKMQDPDTKNRLFPMLREAEESLVRWQRNNPHALAIWTNLSDMQLPDLRYNWTYPLYLLLKMSPSNNPSRVIRGQYPRARFVQDSSHSPLQTALNNGSPLPPALAPEVLRTLGVRR